MAAATASGRHHQTPSAYGALRAIFAHFTHNASTLRFCFLTHFSSQTFTLTIVRHTLHVWFRWVLAFYGWRNK